MTELETESTPLPPPTPAPLPERRWARSDDRVVFGVAGGLGHALAIDPLFVRIAFVVLALFSGVGVIFYIAALALLADSPTSPQPTTVRRIAGAVAILLSARWLFNGEAGLPDTGWVVAIALLGAAVALWRGRSAELTTAPPAADTLASSDGGSTSDRWDSWTARRRDRPRPPRSPLGLLTVGAATVVGALVWLIADNGDRGTLAFGWATVVLGAGLIVGTFAGRARWLFVPALVTAIAAVGASALNFAGVGLGDHSGDRSVYIGEGTPVSDRYETGMGNFDLNLVDYRSDLATTVEVGIGNLTVVVPDDAQVQIDARVGVGSIDAFGRSRSGYRRSLRLDSQTDGEHMITLKLRVGVGDIEVRRASFAGGPFLGLTSTTYLPLPVSDIPAVQFFGDGTVLYQDGSITFGDGGRIESNGTYTIPIIEQRPDGSVQLQNGAVVRADGAVISPDGFLIPRQLTPSPSTLGLTTTTLSLVEPSLGPSPVTTPVPTALTTEVPTP
jgi:phage shock protein PspC (stress-responsive transcriptional regulator)